MRRVLSLSLSAGRTIGGELRSLSVDRSRGLTRLSGYHVARVEALRRIESVFIINYLAKRHISSCSEVYRSVVARVNNARFVLVARRGARGGICVPISEHIETVLTGCSNGLPPIRPGRVGGLIGAVNLLLN